MLLSTDGGGVKLFLMPSSPADSMHASDRYGLHVGSGLRNSMRVPSPLDAGMRMSGERFFVAHAK